MPIDAPAPEPLLAEPANRTPQLGEAVFEETFAEIFGRRPTPAGTED